MRRLLAALVLSAALSSCGSSDDLSENASRLLALHVDAVDAAIAEGDRDAAARSLDEVREAVAALETEDEVGSDRAEDILTAADNVEERLDQLTAPTTTTTTAPSTTTTTTTEPPPTTTTTTAPPTTTTAPPTTTTTQPEGQGNGNGNGKGNGGRGGGDEDD